MSTTHVISLTDVLKYEDSCKSSGTLTIHPDVKDLFDYYDSIINSSVSQNSMFTGRRGKHQGGAGGDRGGKNHHYRNYDKSRNNGTNERNTYRGDNRERDRNHNNRGYHKHGNRNGNKQRYQRTTTKHTNQKPQGNCFLRNTEHRTHNQPQQEQKNYVEKTNVIINKSSTRTNEISYRVALSTQQPKQENQSFNKTNTSKPKQTTQGFKVTKLQHIEDDDEIILNKIRVAMNKLSDTNTTQIKMEVLSALMELEKETITPLSIKCFNVIFSLCFSNLYFVDNYCTIFQFILDKVTSLRMIWDNIMKEYETSSLDNTLTSYDEVQTSIFTFYNRIQYFDSDEQYDDFCKENKRTKQYMSFIIFMTILNQKGYMNDECIGKLMNDFYVTTTTSLLNTKSSKNNYIANTLCSIWLEFLKYYKNKDETNEIYVEYHSNWKDIMETHKTTKYPCFTRKTQFTFEDLL